MKTDKTLRILIGVIIGLLLGLLIVCATSCKKKMERSQSSIENVVESDLKAVPVRIVSNSVRSTLYVHEDDEFKAGDLVWSRAESDDTGVKILYIVYDYTGKYSLSEDLILVEIIQI